MTTCADPHPLTRLRTILAALAVLLLVLAGLGAGAPAALADHTQISSFQDDSNLVFCSTARMEQTLATLEGLGVERIRINLQWQYLAPDPGSRHAPKGFDAENPADYPPGVWADYDRLVEAAPRYGMQVQFNVTAPGPLWAMGPHAPVTKTPGIPTANHWYPNAHDFYEFMVALGTRYSGTYDGLPRVALWSIWNEPNFPSWLAPQWTNVDGHHVAEAPIMYRTLLGGAWDALHETGHGSDEILIGEVSSEGGETGGTLSWMAPLVFLRDLYCVNGRYAPLRGESALELGCAPGGNRTAFRTSNPALFDASGWSIHPYNLTEPPSVSLPNPNEAPLVDTFRLGRALDGAFAAYDAHGQMPIDFTEYGYGTNPPDPHEIASPDEQAAWLNESDYMAWADPRVHLVGQYLLYDDAPRAGLKPTQPDYWTFQTGLLFQHGQIKPAYWAYRMPIFIPHPTFRRGASVFVWGQVRPADQLKPQAAEITWQPARGGSYRRIATVVTGAQGYLTAHVHFPGSGNVKIVWSGTGVAFHSRAFAVTMSK